MRMPDLDFEVERAEPLPYAAAPELVFKLRISDAAGDAATPIPAVALRCQVRIEPARRRYAAPEQERLLDLFAEPARWTPTLRSLLWTQTGLVVPSFTGRTVVDLPVPCTFDFNVAATKYFYALEEGDVPLCLLFSGTIFYAEEEGGPLQICLCLLFSGTIFYAEEEGGPLQISPIPWEKEAAFRLPVRIWKEMMELYYPNTNWLCLRRDVFDRLYAYKRRLGLPTWEQAMERLLDASEERVQL
jgi:hypothetical protein